MVAFRETFPPFVYVTPLAVTSPVILIDPAEDNFVAVAALPEILVPANV